MDCAGRFKNKLRFIFILLLGCLMSSVVSAVWWSSSATWSSHYSCINFDSYKISNNNILYMPWNYANFNPVAYSVTTWKYK